MMGPEGGGGGGEGGGGVCVVPYIITEALTSFMSSILKNGI
jgi:hypothetical protein